MTVRVLYWKGPNPDHPKPTEQYQPGDVISVGREGHFFGAIPEHHPWFGILELPFDRPDDPILQSLLCGGGPHKRAARIDFKSIELLTKGRGTLNTIRKRGA